MTNEQRLVILEKHVAELSEIYDSVQVLGSFLTSENRTICQKRGSGNFYARQGMAREFIEENIAEDTAVAIAKKLEPPEDNWNVHTTS